MQDRYTITLKKAAAVFAALLVVAVALSVFVSFLGGGSRRFSLSPLAPSYRSGTTEDTAVGFEGDGADSNKSGSPQMGRVSEGTITQKKVVKIGSIEMTVKKAEDAAEKIQMLAERLNGFVSDSNIYEAARGIKTGFITVRVPADKFDNAISEIKKFAVNVDREVISARDVTEQFVDLEARVKNLRATEGQYLSILKRADTVIDTLSVVQQLNSVRLQIEQLEGQLQYLSRQVDMSSITVQLTAEADVEVFGIRWRPLFVAKEALRNLMSGLAGYVDTMIRFLVFLPVLLLWLATIGVGIWAAWKIGLWIRNKFSAHKDI